MIACKECIESLHPDDPQVRSGRYMMCGCDYCNKPTYYRELEREEPSDKEIQVITRYMYAIVPPLKKGIYKDYNIGGVRHDCEADKADTPDTKGRTQEDRADTADKADRS